MTPVQPGGIAVVTGAASGLGQAMTDLLAAHGMRVVRSDIDAARVQEAAAAVASPGLLRAGQQVLQERLERADAVVGGRQAAGR